MLSSVEVVVVVAAEPEFGSESDSEANSKADFQAI